MGWWVDGWEKEKPVICLNVGRVSTTTWSRRPLVAVMKSCFIWSLSAQINILYTSGIESDGWWHLPGYRQYSLRVSFPVILFFSGPAPPPPLLMTCPRHNIFPSKTCLEYGRASVTAAPLCASPSQKFSWNIFDFLLLFLPDSMQCMTKLRRCILPNMWDISLALNCRKISTYTVHTDGIYWGIQSR